MKLGTPDFESEPREGKEKREREKEKAICRYTSYTKSIGEKIFGSKDLKLIRISQLQVLPLNKVGKYVKNVKMFWVAFFSTF